MLKKLLNKPEAVTHDRLRNICQEYNATVFAKMRLADILPIEHSGISQQEFSFALKSHCDFVVSDAEHNPMFAVEFDGPFHAAAEQQLRDKLKNELCDRFGLPLLRINAGHLVSKYRGMDLLGWLVEMWFLEQEWERQQQAGAIPFDEDFDPFAIVASDGKTEYFPYWLSAPLRAQIRRLCNQDRIRDPCPSRILAADNYGNFHALAWLRLNDSTAVFATVTTHSRGFQTLILDLLDELVVYELHDLVIKCLDRKQIGCSNAKLQMTIADFKANYRTIGYCGISNEADSAERGLPL